MIKETQINDILNRYNEYCRTIQWSKNPEMLYAPIQYIMDQSGKKVRPLSLLISYQLFQSDLTPALSAAYGIEMFHNFSLVHDDIMDDAELRRGLPTTHKKFSVNQAILSGDTMLMESLYYIMKSIHNSDHVKDFIRIAIKVCEGQSMDMQFEKSDRISLEDYIMMIQYKTSILLAQSMKMGAQIAQKDETTQNLLFELGLEIGTAFQLQDDYLDLYSENKQFGKKPGGDLIQRKKSALIVIAVQDMKTTDKIKQFHHYNQWRTDSEQLDYYLDFFKKQRVQAKVSALYEEHFSNARSIIRKLNLDDSSNDLLTQFTELILDRSH